MIPSNNNRLTEISVLSGGIFCCAQNLYKFFLFSMLFGSRSSLRVENNIKGF